MMLVIIMRMLRLKMAPSASFLGRPIRTRQRSRMGIEMTKESQPHTYLYMLSKGQFRT